MPKLGPLSTKRVSSKWDVGLAVEREGGWEEG
jgi:hypothetical protein